MAEFGIQCHPGEDLIESQPGALGVVEHHGVAAKKLFGESVSHPGEPVTDEYRLLLTAAIVGFAIAQVLINSGLDDSLTAQNQQRKMVVYLGAIVIIGGFGLFATRLTGTQLTAVVAAAVVALVADAVVQTKRAENLDAQPRPRSTTSASQSDR